jgi:hypothetical protein
MANSIMEDLYTYLMTQTGLTALIGRRLYPDTLPQYCDHPAVSYEITSDIPVHTMSSDAANPRKPLVSYHVWADTYAGAKAVADQLKTALQDKTGTLTVRVLQRVFLENEYDPPYESDTETHHKVLDFTVWYT